MEYKNKGKGIFLSSHILSEVERLCDRVGIIREGKLVETGTLDELRHLTRITMTVETERPLEGLEKQQGIHDILRKLNNVSFNVDSHEIGNVVTYLSGFGVKKLESVPPTLEDLFIRHYDTDGGQ
jgi:ABC-2 type transport system ATP-binding protein